MPAGALEAPIVKLGGEFGGPNRVEVVWSKVPSVLKLINPARICPGRTEPAISLAGTEWISAYQEFGFASSCRKDMAIRRVPPLESMTFIWKVKSGRVPVVGSSA